jgi:hypothetical protein
MLFRPGFRYTNLAALSPQPSGGGNEAETTTLLAAMSSQPDATRTTAINTLIAALKTAGIWAKLDVLYILAAHDAQAARLNWKTPASFTATAVNTPTFTTDRGYNGNGSTSYLTTGFTPSTHATQMTQNSASVFAWNRTARAGATGAACGCDDGNTSALNLFLRYSDGNAYGRVNDAPSSGGFTNAN